MTSCSGPLRPTKQAYNGLYDRLISSLSLSLCLSLSLSLSFVAETIQSLCKAVCPEVPALLVLLPLVHKTPVIVRGAVALEMHLHSAWTYSRRDPLHLAEVTGRDRS